MTNNKTMPPAVQADWLTYMALALGPVPGSVPVVPPDELIGYPRPTPPAIINQPWLVTGTDFPIVGQFLATVEELMAYMLGIEAEGNMSWHGRGVTLHHTSSPSLSMRPDGWEKQHMFNLRSYYKNTRKFRSGPHIFTDDRGWWIFTPLTLRGVHAKAFNGTHWGIEALGDFDYKDDPTTGRGHLSWQNALLAAACLAKVWDFNPATMVNFHRDDPSTTKDCPGLKINKTNTIAQVAAYFAKL